MNRSVAGFFRSPLFFGILYIFVLIPVYAYTYQAVPSDSFGKSLSIIESFYFSVVTITTLGYGDISPKTPLLQMIVASEAVLGVVVVGFFMNAQAQRSREFQVKALEERMIVLTDSILLHIVLAIETATARKIPQTEIRFSRLTEQRIRDGLAGTFFNSNVNSLAFPVGRTVADSLRKILENAESLMIYTELLDPELIQIISRFDLDQQIERWLREFEAKPIQTQYGVIDSSKFDISSYAPAFYNLHMQYHSLRSYIFKKFYDNSLIRYRIISNSIVHEKEYLKGLNEAKYLFHNKLYQKDAYFLTIVASLKLNRIQKARWALGKYVQLGPENADFIKGQLEQHYSQIITENNIKDLFS
jgi:Ion channel